jgi:hypothetical protein
MDRLNTYLRRPRRVVAAQRRAQFGRPTTFVPPTVRGQGHRSAMFLPAATRSNTYSSLAVDFLQRAWRKLALFARAAKPGCGLERYSMMVCAAARM